MNAIVNPDDLMKGFVDSLKNPSDDIARAILAAAGMSTDELQKSITTSTGLVAYDLQAPAKNLYPVFTPIRNKIPRVGGGVGTATNWKQINAIIGSGYDGMGWVPEGQRSGTMGYSTSNKAASYVTLGEEDYATFEAINAGRGFEDVRARMTMRLLQKTMLKEEQAVAFGNSSLQLGTPVTPSLSAAGSGSSLTNTLMSVIVVALTPEGWGNFKSVGTGIPTSKSITGADGSSYTLNGGCSNKSAAATITPSANQNVSASTTAIQGAAAYAWFWGASGSEVLGAVTTINSVVISAAATGSQNASAVTGDLSTNSLAFDGLYTWAAKAGSGAYVQSLATGTAGTGTTLTASGRGSVLEIDAMMLAMWQNYQVSLSEIFVNAQELKNITSKVLTGASGGSLLNYFHDPKQGEFILTAGGAIEFYYNPFMAPGAGRRIPISIHPMVPPGTIMGWARDLPIQYQSNEVPNIAEIKTRQDFYQIDWPLKTRRREHGVYVEETLAVYAPFSMAILSNIANG